MSVNKVTLLGNTCQDPKIKTLQDGGKVAQFSLATNKRGYTTKNGREIPERTEFHNIVVNGSGLVKVVEQFVKKGNKLYLEGELRTREYADAQGTKRYITEIYVNELELLTPKGTQAPPPPNQQPFEQPNEDEAIPY